jgi:hypothetical protein
VLTEDFDSRTDLVVGVVVDLTKPLFDQLNIDLPRTPSIRFSFYTLKGMGVGLFVVHSSSSDRFGASASRISAVTGSTASSGWM